MENPHIVILKDLHCLEKHYSLLIQAKQLSDEFYIQRPNQLVVLLYIV